MFDKFKARIEKLEETNETFRSVKAHVVKYQVVYACGATAIVSVIVTRQFARPTMITNVIEAPAIAPVFNNTVAPIINNIVNNGGYSRKIIRCLETDQMWPSMKAAAEATGNTLHAMSRHCNGHLDNLQEMHYVIEGLAAG